MDEGLTHSSALRLGELSTFLRSSALSPAKQEEYYVSAVRIKVNKTQRLSTVSGIG